MRSEQEMYDLIVQIARADERIRAVMLNGSRANPRAKRDFFQDFDIVYFVRAVAPFKTEPGWIDRFGERMILQLPDEMGDAAHTHRYGYSYLMQFTDGNRIDLTLFPVEHLAALPADSLSVVLFDKDGLLGQLPAPDDRQYLPTPPSAAAFADCCNEFWWVCPYVAKGLWREEIIYAKTMMDNYLRDPLMTMLGWYVGIRTNFTHGPGKAGKALQDRLEPELWALLLQTYAGAESEPTWRALLAMGDLFRRVALAVAQPYGFVYPHGDDARVSAHLRHVRALPRHAQQMY